MKKIMKENKKVDIVVPVYYKEAPHLEHHIKQQREYFAKNLKGYRWTIVIANNGPRKDAVEIARQLSKKYKHVRYEDVNNPGRGWSLSTSWQKSNADVVMYMDADLATNLAAVPIMLKLLFSNASDVTIGSRYMQGAHARRTLQRYILSKVYNLMLQYILKLRVHDAQCGFKGIKKSVARKIIPLTKDRKWFFDTELLYYAQKKGFKIVEVPVRWEEQKETSVQIISVTINYIKNILRLRFSRI